jgi:ribose/xylose/arabinose/galactoside ABC-type transport system permease subunit
MGALILQMIYNAIIILKINQNYSQIIIGVVIVIAVILDRLNTSLLRRPVKGNPRIATETSAASEEVAG